MRRVVGFGGRVCTPLRPSATSPKCDMNLSVDKSINSVAFGGGRWGLLLIVQSQLDCSNYPIDIIHHSIIPKADYPVVLGFKILGSFAIVFFLL